MVRPSEILGMNARSHLYIARYNARLGKRIADHKLLTKSLLRKNKLSTPKLYRVFRRYEDIQKFDFIEKLPESFVVKPDNSLGGEGIIVIRRRGKYAGEWYTFSGERLTLEDLKLHLQDILDGRFSMEEAPDLAFIEERVRIHPTFKKYCWKGTPDIGVLVFNFVPVMAYLRLPTEESGGRANMFQGALACGIDLATGITIQAIKHTHSIKYYPGTKRKLRGIKIPDWEKVLLLASKCQFILSNLGFMRADIVLQPAFKGVFRPGPMVLELNAQPGLKIQIANQAGLKKRLERVEGLKVDSPEKGVKIAQELFGEPSLAKVGVGTKKVGVFNEVLVRTRSGEKLPVKVKIDTGAFRTSIDKSLAEKLGLMAPEEILFEKGYRTAMGKEVRPVVPITFWLEGKKIKTSANISSRTPLRRPMIIGRRDLKGFLVEPKG